MDMVLENLRVIRAKGYTCKKITAGKHKNDVHNWAIKDKNHVDTALFVLIQYYTIIFQ